VILLLPLWPKDELKFPKWTLALLLINAFAFLISGAALRQASTGVSEDDLRQNAKKLVAVLQDPESGINEPNREILNTEMQATPFPSAHLVEFLNQTQMDASMLRPKARYEWDLIYPIFESYSRSTRTPAEGGTFFQRWGFDPDRNWWPALITHQFLHDGWLHLILNFVFLWIAASLLENKMGMNVVWLYLAGGVAGAFAQVQYGIPSGQILVGASGAISALLGYCLLALPRAKVKLFYFVLLLFVPKYGLFDCPLWFFVPIWLLTQVLLAMINLHSPTMSNAYAAHIGGFVFGCIAALIVKI
jgi:membrane associated rhomboid family serine protease